MEKIAQNIWLHDGNDLRFLSLHMPLRMAVVQLANGDLWVHSPVSLDASLIDAVENLGPVKHLVAPNDYHHLYLSQWQERWPDALTYGVPGLLKKRQDLHFDAVLDGEAVSAWAPDVEYVVFRGNRLMDEAVFFHRPSGLVLLTDLMLNFKVDRQNVFSRAFARFDGVAYPDGGTPRLFRWSMKDRSAARQAVQHILAWQPAGVVIAHGEYFPSDGQRVLERAFAWLR